VRLFRTMPPSEEYARTVQAYKLSSFHIHVAEGVDIALQTRMLDCSETVKHT
jgi:hypothetical protein